MTAPAISIVMSNYNKGKYIDWAIRSAISQTVSDFELIVVDDSSTDASLDIVEKAQRTDSRIALIKHEKNRGDSASRNDGIARSKASAITFLDSDDVMAPDRLERDLAILEKEPSPAVIYSDSIIIGEGVATIKSIPAPDESRPGKEMLSHLLRADFPFTGGSITLPRLCFDQVGVFDESLKYGQDFDLCLRLAETFPYVHNPVCTYGYRIYQSNTARTMTQRARYGYRGRIRERYLLKHLDLLDSKARQQCFDDLFSCFVATRDWRKVLRYGLSHKEGMISMLQIPRHVAVKKTRRLVNANEGKN